MFILKQFLRGVKMKNSFNWLTISRFADVRKFYLINMLLFVSIQVVFDLRPARLTTARLYDCLDHTSYRTYDNFCPHIYIHVYNKIRLTTGWSEPNAVVSRTLSVLIGSIPTDKSFC